MKQMLLAIVLVTVSACDGNSTFSGLSNYELQDAHRECRRGGHTGAGAQRCKGIYKECQKRKEATGFRC